MTTVRALGENVNAARSVPRAAGVLAEGRRVWRMGPTAPERAGPGRLPARRPSFANRNDCGGPTMTSKDFPIFDCDSHIVEPPAIWDEYVPSSIRSWVKTQFHFHTDTDLLHINGRVVP